MGAALSAFVPTRRVDVLRGTTTDVFGDPADTDTVVAPGVPCSLVEVSRREQEPVSGMWRTVRRFRARFRPGVDVRDGDRLRDARDASTYLVEGVSAPTDLVGAADLLCDLKRVTKAG